MGHCEKPCDNSPYDAVDGEHDWGNIELVGFEAREHCHHCYDEECKGREYKNPLLAGSDWTDPKG